MNNIEKAQKSQNIVSKKLKECNFILSEVKKPSSNGIDIVAIKDNKHFAIEVKSVVQGNRCWFVHKIHPLCDIVAVVMPNESVHFESAKDWNKMATKNGTRRITHLVNFYNCLGKKV